MVGAVVADNADFVVGKMGEGVGGEGEVPIAVVVAAAWVGVVVPVVEVADEGKLVGVGRVFAVGPLLVGFVKKEAVGAVENGLVLEGDDSEVFEEAVATFGDGITVRGKPRVVGDEFEFFFHNEEHGKSGPTNRARFSRF